MFLFSLCEAQICHLYTLLAGKAAISCQITCPMLIQCFGIVGEEGNSGCLSGEKGKFYSLI